MIIDRYLRKIIFKTVMLTLLILLSLSGIINFIEQLRKIGQGNYSILDAGYYTLLSLPKDIDFFFPIATLLGSLLGLGILSQQRELIIMQAFGLSHIQVIMMVIKTSIPLIILSILMGELIAPTTKQMAHNYRKHHLYNIKDTKNNELWIRNGKNLIYIENIKNSNEITGINIYSFNEERQLLNIQHANKGIWDQQESSWILSQVKISDFTDPKQVKIFNYLNKTWKTYLSPEKLNFMMLKPDEMTINILYNYINFLKNNNLESDRFLLDMWKRILRPFSVIVMMLLAVSLIFSPLYVTSMSMRILIGMSFGFFFYILDQLFGLLSLLYKLPIVLGAILPSGVFFLIISFLFLIKRY